MRNFDSNIGTETWAARNPAPRTADGTLDMDTILQKTSDIATPNTHQIQQRVKDIMNETESADNR